MNRAQILAPASLFAAVTLFAVTLPFRDTFAGALFHAFAEASMIGGLADWFAVVALFRHPFGIPIPHTAIIPRYRRRLTEGIVATVQNTWLNKESLLRRIEGRAVLPAIAEYLARPANRALVRDLLRSLLRSALEMVDTRRFAAFVRREIGAGVARTDITRGIARAGRFATDRRWHQTLLDGVLRGAPDRLRADAFRAMLAATLRDAAASYATSPARRIGKWLAENTRALRYEDLADSLIATIEREAADILASPEHLFRTEFDAWIAGMLARLEQDAETGEALYEKYHAALHSTPFGDWLEQAGRDVLDRVMRDLDAPDSFILGHADALMDDALAAMRAGGEAARRMERWLKDRIVEFVDTNHGEIGRIVRDNLDALDEKELVTLIETRVGPDLQYIRVNGALIGGLVGAALFLVKLVI